MGMSNLINSDQARTILKISRMSLARYIKSDKLKVSGVKGRSNLFLLDDILELEQTVKEGKKLAGKENNRHESGKEIKQTAPSAELDEVGNEIIAQIVEDMKALNVEHENFSIQIHETALNYQLYKHYQSLYLRIIDKEYRAAFTTFYKAYNDGLKSLGLTPQAKKQLGVIEDKTPPFKMFEYTA